MSVTVIDDVNFISGKMKDLVKHFMFAENMGFDDAMDRAVMLMATKGHIARGA